MLEPGRNFALLGLLLSSPSAAGGPLPLRYEAEEQSLGAGAVIIASSLASGGRAVHMEDAGSVRWTVRVPVAGRYELWLRYCARGGEKVAQVAVNGRELGLGLPRTGEEWGEISFVRTLAAGENSILLRKDWPGLSVDYLRFAFLGQGEVQPLVELPVLIPRSNIRTLGQRGESLLKVERGGHRLFAIREGARSFPFTLEPCGSVDDAVLVRLQASGFEGLKSGRHPLTLHFEDGMELVHDLELRERPEACPWTIVTLQVGHGSATFMRLPSGRSLLLDTAQVAEAERVVIPFLERCLPSLHGQRSLDHLILTHYHDDHDGGLPEIRRRMDIGHFWDYRSWRVGESFDLEGVRVTVLNAFESGQEENTRSLALRFEYGGFVYTHGADNDGVNQVRQREHFPAGMLRSHVYAANHHLHGPLDAGFYRRLDPVLVLVSADEALHARGAFTTVFRQDVAGYLKGVGARFRETLPTCDVGHITLRIRGAEDWSYESVPDLDGIALP